MLRLFCPRGGADVVVAVVAAANVVTDVADVADVADDVDVDVAWHRLRPISTLGAKTSASNDAQGLFSARSSASASASASFLSVDSNASVFTSLFPPS